MNKIHYVDQYLIAPPHKVSVCVVGAGGSGSRVLSTLANINQAIISMGHPGLYVTCFDDDTVSKSNIGRQMFSPEDIGEYKSTVLISRINRHFGTDWQSRPERYKNQQFNIIISCVDNIITRVKIHNSLKNKTGYNGQPWHRLIYWLDFGNTKDKGQAILGTFGDIEQPNSEYETVSKLKNIMELHPEMKSIKEQDTGPSCSTREALMKQDLLVNSTLVQLGMNLLWKLFISHRIQYHGVYMNLETLSSRPLKIK